MRYLSRLLATASALPLALAALTATAAPATASSEPCPGAHLPDGFVIDHGVPHLDHTPYTPVWRYNPQSISGFILRAGVDATNNAKQRACLTGFGADALIAGSRTQAVSTSTGTSTARLMPYPFAFSANPATATLAPGWVSGLGQGSALRAMLVAAAVTGDEAYLSYGRQVLASFDIPFDDGGFTTRENGLTYFQEYPTVPYGYVLNGMQETLISLYTWAQATGDQHARELADEGAASTAKVRALHEVALPQGILTSYDMLRGRTPAAPLRVLATGAGGVTARVTSARVVDSSGGRYSPVIVPVATSTTSGPNLLTNAGFTTWSGIVPAGWTARTYPGRATAGAGSNRYLHLAATTTTHPGIGQSVPSAALTPGVTYRLSFRARVVLTDGVAGTSGRYQVTASCSGQAVRLADQAVIRGERWAWYDAAVTMPAARSCSATVAFTPLAPTPGTSLDVDDVSLTRTEAAPRTGRPALPLSVLAVPDPELALTYTGAGQVQAWREGRWVTLASLPVAHRPTTRTVDIPAWAQGRTVNWGYHEIHVAELVALTRLTGDTSLLPLAGRWAAQAPSRHALSFTS